MCCTDDCIQAHCAEIERCNQRGGRMLSVVDLVEAGTLTMDLAAYALAAVGNGASFMIGAMPGGAGKTTVMGALLNCVPADVPLVPADSLSSVEAGMTAGQDRACFVCHEIGSGPYYAYLWGDALRAFFDLPDAGHIMATNLHADTYHEAYDQVCGQNGVAPVVFRKMNLLFFLAVEQDGWHSSRRVSSVWESDGLSEHVQVLGDCMPSSIGSTGLVPADQFGKARERINRLMASGARTIYQVREQLLA